MKSGVRIAGALVLSLVVFALFLKGYHELISPSGPHGIAYGSALLAALGIFLAATVQYWRIWFPVIPGYIGLRSLWGFYFGWFAPDISGLWVVVLPLLMFTMALLSIRFSKKNFRLSIIDRTVLLVVLFCVFVAITNLLLLGLVKSVVILTAVGDGILLLSWLHWKRFHLRGAGYQKHVRHQGETVLR